MIFIAAQLMHEDRIDWYRIPKYTPEFTDNLFAIESISQQLQDGETTEEERGRYLKFIEYMGYLDTPGQIDQYSVEDDYGLHAHGIKSVFIYHLRIYEIDQPYCKFLQCKES